MNNSTPMIARKYDSNIEKIVPFYSEFYKQTIDLIKSLPIEGGIWLDTGCGTGELVSLAIREFDNFKFVLCDPSEAMIAETNEKLASENRIINTHICGSHQMKYRNKFNILTAIQSHHYMEYEDRKNAIRNCYNALKDNGIFIFFENFAPNCEFTKTIVLDRWRRYQREQGKSEIEVAKHLSRYNRYYFPLSIEKHFSLLSNNGFRYMDVFWLSYMQVGIYAIK